MAIRAYNSPGVQVTETVNPALAPLLANPSLICLVGDADGTQVASERVYLSGTTPVLLRYTGVNTGSLVVKHNVTGEVLNAGTYVVTTGTDPNLTIAGDEPSSIARFGEPATAPIAAAGTGTLTGTFVYAYSFVNALGESGISAGSNQLVLVAQGGSLSGVTVGPTGTLSRNIYRAPVVGGIVGQFTLVGTISGNITTVIANETAAASSTLPKTGIASNDTVLVTYNYIDQYYFEPTLMSDYDDIVTKYGAPFDANGAISSQLSFAAMVAFQNGASEMVLLASATGSDADIALALAKIESDESIQAVGVVSGSTAVLTSLNAHITSMNTQGRFRIGMVGRDGSLVPISATSLRSGQVFNNEGVAHVSPSMFKMINPVTGREMVVGGQYAAAGALGMLAARDVHIPLTRKTLAGFTGLGETRTATELALDSAAGLMVIEERNGVLRVRHGITTAAGNINTRELSVVRAKYDMGHRLRNTLDGIIGIVAPVQDAPGIVSSLVRGVLEQIALEGAISNYRNVKARLLASDLTTVEVRFEYTPAYPINNIIVNFTINTQTGDFALAEAA